MASSGDLLAGLVPSSLAAPVVVGIPLASTTPSANATSNSVQQGAAGLMAAPGKDRLAVRDSALAKFNSFGRMTKLLTTLLDYVALCKAYVALLVTCAEVAGYKLVATFESLFDNGIVSQRLTVTPLTPEQEYLVASLGDAILSRMLLEQSKAIEQMTSALNWSKILPGVSPSSFGSVHYAWYTTYLQVELTPQQISELMLMAEKAIDVASPRLNLDLLAIEESQVKLSVALNAPPPTPAQLVHVIYHRITVSINGHPQLSVDVYLNEKISKARDAVLAKGSGLTSAHQFEFRAEVVKLINESLIRTSAGPTGTGPHAFVTRTVANQSGRNAGNSSGKSPMDGKLTSQHFNSNSFTQSPGSNCNPQQSSTQSAGNSSYQSSPPSTSTQPQQQSMPTHSDPPSIALQSTVDTSGKSGGDGSGNRKGRRGKGSGGGNGNTNGRGEFSLSLAEDFSNLELNHPNLCSGCLFLGHTIWYCKNKHNTNYVCGLCNNRGHLPGNCPNSTNEQIIEYARARNARKAEGGEAPVREPY